MTTLPLNLRLRYPRPPWVCTRAPRGCEARCTPGIAPSAQVAGSTGSVFLVHPLQAWADMTTFPLALAVALHLLGQEAPRPESVPPPPEPIESEPARAPIPESPPSRSPVLSRVTLRDGQVLRGFVVQRDEQHVVLELADGNRVDLAARTVERVEEEPNARVTHGGEIWIQDPNRTRYFYAPSAMMLHQGEGYFSQRELIFSSFNYGLTDHITVQAGAVVPAWFVQGGFNFIGAIKVGGSLSDRVHLAAGAQALVIPGFTSDIGVVGLVFGTLTYGTPDAHVSVAVGAPFQLTNASGKLANDYIITLSGSLRVSQRVGLITENWLLPTWVQAGLTPPMINSAGVRLFGEHWAVDLGAIHVPSVDIPIPWVDFTYNFGG